MLLGMKKKLPYLCHQKIGDLTSTESPQDFVKEHGWIPRSTIKDDTTVRIDSHAMTDDSMLLKADDLYAFSHFGKPSNRV